MLLLLLLLLVPLLSRVASVLPEPVKVCLCLAAVSGTWLLRLKYLQLKAILHHQEIKPSLTVQKEGIKDREIASHCCFSYLCVGGGGSAQKGVGRLVSDSVDGEERRKSSRGQDNLEESIHHLTVVLKLHVG